MNATVVKLNTLPNTVRPPTQHHDLGALAHRNRVRCMVRGVVVGSVVNTTHSNRLIAMTKAQGPTARPDVHLRHIQKLCQIRIRKAVLLGPYEKLIRETFRAMIKDLLLKLDQLKHLLNKPGLYGGLPVQQIDRRSLPQCLVHHKLALARRLSQSGQKLIKSPLVVITGKTQTVAPYFKRTYSFLQRLLVGLSDRHHFAHSSHLGAQLVFCAPKLLEGPAGELGNHIVSRRRVLLQGPVPPVWDLIQGQTCG